MTLAPAAVPAMTLSPAAAKELLLLTVPEALPVLLTGAPGVGKTAIVRQVAEELEYELVISHPVTSEPTDFRGLPWVVDGRAAVMQLVHRDSRALNGFCLPENVAVVACTNRPQDRAGVGTFLAPLVSRFTTVLAIEPDPLAFVRWAITDGGFHPLVASFLRWKPEYLLDQTRPSHSLEQRCSPRTWENVSRLVALGLKSSQLAAPVLGAITPSIAIEFLAFLEIYESLPNADLVRADPDNAPIPDGLDARYATTSHLALAVGPADFDPFHRYMARLAPEFQLLFMLSAIARFPALIHTATYIAWATRPENAALLQ
jgi:hypothetical protein